MAIEEALKLVDGDRREAYGPISDDMERIARLWSVIIGVQVEPRHIPLCMIAVKMSREIYKHKKDNCVDMAGYAELLDRLYGELNPLP